MGDIQSEAVLEEVGLSKNQAKVYAALLEFGPSSAGVLASKIEVHRTNIYDALNGLIDRGLVSYVYKGKIKYFEAASPEVILSLLKEKEEHFHEVLPLLLMKKKHATFKQQATIYEGIQGVKFITDDMLREGKGVVAFGIPSDMAERIKTFVSAFHKRRIEKKVCMKHLYDADAKDRIAYLNSLPYTEARYLPQDYASPATTTVYGDKIAFFIWSQPVLGILIESSRMAEKYRYYFNVLWNVAKK